MPNQKLALTINHHAFVIGSGFNTWVLSILAPKIKNSHCFWILAAAGPGFHRQN